MQKILDVIHNTIYQFFDVCAEDEEVPISDKDKLLLEVNKAICNNLKALEYEPVFYPQEKPVIAKTIISTDNTSGKVFNEYGDYVYPSDVVLEIPNTATSTFVAGHNMGYRDGK